MKIIFNKTNKNEINIGDITNYHYVLIFNNNDIWTISKNSNDYNFSPFCITGNCIADEKYKNTELQDTLISFSYNPDVLEAEFFCYTTKKEYLNKLIQLLKIIK